jgi:hypothetical protein
MYDKFFINAAIIFWLVFIGVICVIVMHQGVLRTVTPNYFTAAELWLQGRDLYDATGHGFIYLPQAAILFIPFAYLAQWNFAGAEIVWRLISLLLLMLAIWHFAGLVEQKFLARTFFIITLVTLPLVFSSARNGQFNTILTVMMLFATCAVAKARWSLAVFYLVMGFALKPTMIVLLLLLWGLYRPLWWRVPVGLLVMFLLPFFTQTPYYVVAQYSKSIGMLQVVAAVGANTAGYTQFFSLLAQLKVIMSLGLQNIIRGVVAVYVWFCGFIAKRFFKQNYLAIYLYTLATSYLMLFNPRTEGNDYGIIAPAVGLFISLSYAWRDKKQFWWLIFVVVGLIVSGHFTFIMGQNGYDYWSAPFFTLIFVIIIARIFMLRKNFLCK